MKLNPITVLKKHLEKLNIECDYDEHEPSLVISFAEKKVDSIHNIDYKSIEILHHPRKKQFHLSIYTYFNSSDYFELPNFTVMHAKWPDDDIHSQLLAITLKYYIQASEAGLTIVDMLQNIQPERN